MFLTDLTIRKLYHFINNHWVYLFRNYPVTEGYLERKILTGYYSWLWSFFSVARSGVHNCANILGGGQLPPPLLAICLPVGINHNDTWHWGHQTLYIPWYASANASCLFQTSTNHNSKVRFLVSFDSHLITLIWGEFLSVKKNLLNFSSGWLYYKLKSLTCET